MMFEVPNNVSQAKSYTIMVEEIPQHMQNKSLLRKWYLISTSTFIKGDHTHTHTHRERERESREQHRAPTRKSTVRFEDHYPFRVIDVQIPYDGRLLRALLAEKKRCVFLLEAAQEAATHNGQRPTTHTGIELGTHHLLPGCAGKRVIIFPLLQSV